ncbi:MAG: thermonuclease family protein, partial [Candidatus Omnitrophica bacterium]|nr:thermonuclease family protein [Candidatus Omnitrophota bacterium]
MFRLILPFVVLSFSMPAWAQTFTIDHIIDGETIQMTNGEIVRLAAIDISFGRTLVDNGSVRQAAEDFLRALSLKGKDVRLEFAVPAKDPDGKLWAYVYVREPTALRDTYLAFGDTDPVEKGLKGSLYYEIFLNAKMIRFGHARPSNVRPNAKYSEMLNRLHQEAFEDRRGFYRYWDKGVPDGTYY